MRPKGALVIAGLLVAANFAFAGVGPENCPFALVSKANVTRTKGGAELVMEVSGTGKEVQEKQRKLVDILDDVVSGKHKCGEPSCPFEVQGVKYELQRIENGVKLTVTGDARAVDEFVKRAKAAVDRHLSGKHHHHGHHHGHHHRQGENCPHHHHHHHHGGE